MEKNLKLVCPKCGTPHQPHSPHTMDADGFEIESAVVYGIFHIWVSNRMKRLKDFKITERIPRAAVKVVSM